MSNEKYQELFDLNISSPQVVLDRFKTRISGLTKTEVLNRRLVYGANETVHEKQGKFVREFFAKLTSPLSVMLFVVAGFSFYFGQNISAIIVIAMAGVSVVLSSVQELKASNSAKKLKAMVHVQIEVMRDGKIIKVPIREIVPGDIVELVPGGMTPADIKIISGNGLTFNQATLNGESFPVEKNDQGKVGINNIYELSSIALMGSSVVSGMGKGLVIATGLKTEFGRMAKDIAESAPDTPFDQGLKQFTWLMIRLITGLVIFIFLINTLLKGDFIASLLFSLAVAVGLTPEMLPMIVTLTLSKGAMAMSKKKVIIKRLDAIQNFGAMDVLCTDKTGTLTLDEIALVRHCDANLKDSDDVWREACITSALQGGAKNVLDDAIINYKQLCQDGVKKITEIPFDFERRLMSVVIKENKKLRLITKGAPEGIFSRISLIEVGGKNIKVTKQKLVDLQDGYDLSLIHI